MSHEAVSWAMDEAPMLLTAAGKPDTTARYVLASVAERADKCGRNAHPSIADIRYRTGFDRSTVQRALRRLEAAELLVRRGVTKDGCTRWDCGMDLRRPPTDWQEIERDEDAFRSAAAERKRRSRERSVTHSKSVTVTGEESVTEPEVTHSEGVTEADVTDSKSVTGGDVTHFKSGRHALEVCDTADVTHFTPGRHALNAARTTLEPSRELTTLEPSGSETPPSSESPRDGEQSTIDGEEAPPPKTKRGRTPKPRPEPTLAEQKTSEADQIAHWWWDRRCPKLGIPVVDSDRFPGFRKFLVSFLIAKQPASPQEVQEALEICRESWPSKTRFAAVIRDMRGKAPQQSNGRPSNLHQEAAAGAQLAEAFGS